MNRTHVNYEIEGHIALVTIDNPKMNALSSRVIDELSSVIEELDLCKEIGVAIITGGGSRSFVAGADIKGFKEFIGNREAAFNSSRSMQAVFSKIENARLVVIAAINGLALGGGCELAAACDIRIAAESAIIGVPEVKLGLIPGAGGTQRLVRLLGKGNAKYMVLTGAFLTAQEALQIGLVQKVVPNKNLLQEARSTADAILTNAPLAVEAGKRAINKGIEMSLEDGLRYEADLVGDLFLTEDLSEGAQAFIEKRTPVFRRK